MGQGRLKFWLAGPSANTISHAGAEGHVSGEVAEPGVYALTEGDRVADAIAAAGGATDKADLSAVNMALRLRDEDHHHVPAMGDTPAVPSSPLDASNRGKIDINSALVEILQTLKGIGEVKARAIIDYREENGRFEAPEDILNVPGIGSVTFEGIRDNITVR